MTTKPALIRALLTSGLIALSALSPIPVYAQEPKATAKAADKARLKKHAADAWKAKHKAFLAGQCSFFEAHLWSRFLWVCHGDDEDATKAFIKRFQEMGKQAMSRAAKKPTVADAKATLLAKTDAMEYHCLRAFMTNDKDSQESVRPKQLKAMKALLKTLDKASGQGYSLPYRYHYWSERLMQLHWQIESKNKGGFDFDSDSDEDKHKADHRRRLQALEAALLKVAKAQPKDAEVKDCLVYLKPYILNSEEEGLAITKGKAPGEFQMAKTKLHERREAAAKAAHELAKTRYQSGRGSALEVYLSGINVFQSAFEHKSYLQRLDYHRKVFRVLKAKRKAKKADPELEYFALWAELRYQDEKKHEKYDDSKTD